MSNLALVKAVNETRKSEKQISLLDDIAILAMRHLLTEKYPDSWSNSIIAKKIAEDSYQIASAMLQARKQYL
jgi:hypothetical protein